MNKGTGWYATLNVSERQAVEGFLAARNRMPWRVALGASTVAAVVSMLVRADAGQWLRFTAWAFFLAGILAIYLAGRRPTFVRYSRTVMLAHLIALLLAIALTVGDPMARFVMAAILFPASFLFFRFRGAEIAILGAVSAGVAGWQVHRVALTTEEPWIAMGVVAGVWIFVATQISHKLSTRGRRAFIDQWREQARMVREHRRMRGELDDARTIQLGMLPKSLPVLPWLDASAICLPASEVGGDYYDFLELDDGRLAVVVADVAGHGMSSGMVLSSLRGGLYLLRDELDRPAEALVRLGRMLRSTTGSRMFVTFQLAILDPRASDVIVVSAGHPPVIVADRQGRVDLLGKPAPPLGTALPSSLEPHHRPLEPDDILVLYSDGLVETTNEHGQALGHDRLAADVGRLYRLTEARGIRDGLLGRIASYKGDVEQEDDMTIVALRYRGAV